MEQGIFGSGEQANGIDAYMVVETLIFCINKCMEKSRVHFLVFDRRTVFAEILSNSDTISTIDFGCLANLWILNT